MKPDMTLAVAYARVSTEDQRLGVEAQAAANAAYASAHGLRVVASFTDQGVSGASDLADRPGLMEALEAMRAQGAGVLLVAKRDRLARDVFVALAIERELASFGAVVACPEGGMEVTPEAVFLRRLLDAMAELERAKIRGRTKMALAAKKARGEYYGGGARYGMRVVGKRKLVEAGGGKLRPVPRPMEPEPRELAAVALAKVLQDMGYPPPRIATTLEAQGHRPRKGGRWHPEQIRRLLRAAT